MKKAYKVMLGAIFLIPVAIFFLAIFYGIPERIVRYNYSVVGLQFLAMLITAFFCFKASLKFNSKFWARLSVYIIALFLFGLATFGLGYLSTPEHNEWYSVLPIFFFIFSIFGLSTISTIFYSSNLIIQANLNKKRTGFLFNNIYFFIAFILLLLIISFIPTISIHLYFPVEYYFIQIFKLIFSFTFPIAMLLFSNAYFRAKYSKDSWFDDLKYAYWGTNVFCATNISFYFMMSSTRFYKPIYFNHVPQSIYMYLLAATFDSLFVVSLGLISLGAYKRMQMADNECKITASKTGASSEPNESPSLIQ